MGYEKRMFDNPMEYHPFEYYDWMSVDDLKKELKHLQEWLEDYHTKEPAMKRNNHEYGHWYSMVEHIVMDIDVVVGLIKEKSQE